MKITSEGRTWHTSKVNEFWGNIACAHNVFNIYESEDSFIDLLAGFVGTGINAGDCNIVIATNKHLEKLRQNLTEHGVHVDRLIEDERYYPVDADKLLERFMIKELPDEHLFFQCMNNLIKVAQKRNRRIRIYREMVSILHTNGNERATRHLEAFWNKLSGIEHMLIFCAYPKRNFLGDECLSLKGLGVLNSKVVRNTKSAADIMHSTCPAY